MSNDKQSKTETNSATLKKAREEGQVARSAELGSWVTLAAASVLIPLYRMGTSTTRRAFRDAVGPADVTEHQ